MERVQSERVRALRTTKKIAKRFLLRLWQRVYCRQIHVSFVDKTDKTGCAFVTYVPERAAPPLRQCWRRRRCAQSTWWPRHCPRCPRSHCCCCRHWPAASPCAHPGVCKEVVCEFLSLCVCVCVCVGVGASSTWWPKHCPRWPRSHCCCCRHWPAASPRAHPVV